MPHGLSQREAAELMGISQAALSKIEAGKAAPSLSTLLRIQAVFDLDSLEVILGGFGSRELSNDAFPGRGQRDGR